MTFQEMQDLLWQRIDQSGSPAFTPIETDRLLNWASDVYYIVNRSIFNKDQKNTVNLTYLMRPFILLNTNKVTVVGAGADIPDYRDLAIMTATFPFTDCNQVVTNKPVNVVPMPMSATDRNMVDPFNKPTNQFPFYKQAHDGAFRTIEISSTTVPVSVQGYYFKTLQVIDATNNPTAVFEGQDYIARQIVDIAKVLMKGDVDDYAAVKNAMQETGLTMGTLWQA